MGTVERRPSKAPEAGPRRVALPSLSVRVGIQSINEEDRTVDVVLSTGAEVERMDFWTGKRYVERLSLDPKHVRIDRLNAGAPLLDSHSTYSVADQLGAVVPGSVTLAKGEMRARVRFSRREAVEGIWQDVRDGLVNGLSIGYRVRKYEEVEGKGNALPVRTATDWEVYEASMVSVPADAGAKVRDGQLADSNDCEIVPAAPAAASTPAEPANEERSMTEQNQPAASVVADMSLTPPAPAPAPPAPTEGETARAAERERIQAITQACRAERMPQSVLDELVSNGTPYEAAAKRIFAEVAIRSRDDVPTRPGGRVEVTGDDPSVVIRDGIIEALCHRAHPEAEVTERGEKRKVGFALTEKAKPYMGLDLVRIAERLLIARGVQAARLTREEIASMALRGGGMHSSSDFPLILADVAGKTLRAGYDEAPQTFGPITRRVQVADFKDVKRTQLGEAPQLAGVNEHGEITSGSIAEGREVYAVSTYGKIFSITRKAIVNDDLDAFSRVPMMMGRQARNLESDLVWAQITSNPTMGDGVALFHATHANVDSTGAAISIASIGAARTAMRKQTGKDGSTKLNVVPRYLIVPANLETIADQFVSQNLLASAAGSVNPFAGRLQVIAEPRLDDNSNIIWYVAAAIAEFGDIIELATLAGTAGPRLESEMGFEIEGVKFKVVYDLGAKVIDHRPLYRNAGAS